MNDLGHIETDQLLNDLERKIKIEYRRAVVDAEQKLTEYFADFQRKDKLWEEWVKNGVKTEKEWKQWRTGQMMVGDRWREMRNTLAEDYHNANLMARSMTNGYMPDVYALNHNYATFLVEKGSGVDTAYTLYDRNTVERLIRDEPELLQPPGANMKRVLASRKDLAWQKGQIQSVTLQGILQGESIGAMANRIAYEMGEINHTASVRYARTAVTGAENAGRLDGYKRADNMGIKMKQTWIATLDGRTRHEHRQLDGQTVGIDEPFKVDGYEIRFPGDPQAEAFLIWNCRCTTIAQIDGFERNPEDMGLRRDEKLGEMSYDEWKNEHAGKKENAPLREEKINYAQKVGGIYDRHTKENGLNRTGFAEMQSHGFATVGADYNNMTEESARVFDGAITKMAEKYDTSLSKVRTMTPQEALAHQNRFANVHHNYSVDTSEMVINPTKCKDIEELAKRIRELSDSGYTIPIIPGMEKEYVPIHEFAHTIFDTGGSLRENYVGADFRKVNMARKEIQSLYEKYASTIGKLDTERKKFELDAIMTGNPESAKKAQELIGKISGLRISRYSVLNADEFMAEAVTNAEIGTSNSEYAKKAVEIVKKYFGR